MEPIDGLSVFLCDLYHRELGGGNAYGVVGIETTDDPNMVRYIIRNVITFPGQPSP